MARDRQRDPNALPEDFAYLQPTITRIRHLPLSLPLIERARDHLRPDEYEQLVRTYHEIATRADARRLSAWVEMAEAASSGSLGSFWASDAGKVFHLLALFSRLAHEGEAPFTSRAVEFDPPEPAMDWGKLPEALRYVAGAADKFGRRKFGDRLEDLVAKTPEADLRELRLFRDQVVRAGHRDLLFAWVEQGIRAVGNVDHEEADRVNNLLDFMDAAGIGLK